MPQGLIDHADDQLVNISSDAVRQQAITWANVDPDPCHHIAPLGHYELIWIINCRIQTEQCSYELVNYLWSNCKETLCAETIK